MKNKVLLKEIPSGKFHSAVFTTYSINLYYLEQQVLPLLNGKGIHYVSILADANMLTTQLGFYSSLSEKRKRNYSIHGIESKGAFHPKLIFLAGDNTIAVLLGSGNLTSAGHGKNLETWNVIYVENNQDVKYGFILQVWSYIKQLHNDLGYSANLKISSIEENSSLLAQTDNFQFKDWYNLSRNERISFVTDSEISIFKRITDLIDDQDVDSITVMSPYYDLEGELLHLLNKQFSPKNLNIILQDNFGSLPLKMKLSPNMKIYDWIEVTDESIQQHFFHAKNFIFTTRNGNYLLSGSANASINAFGKNNVLNNNHESCVLYFSNQVDYHQSLGIKLINSTYKIDDFEVNVYETDSLTQRKKNVFIKSSERNGEDILINYSASENVNEVELCLIDSTGNRISVSKQSLIAGQNNLKLVLDTPFSFLYSEFYLNDDSISNKQFVIDVSAFESTNPSPRNRSLNQIKKIIENGLFSSSKLIDYLTTLHNQKATIKNINKSVSNENEEKESYLREDEGDLLYLSYEEIQNKVKQFSTIENGKAYVDYKGIQIWESIYNYLYESKAKDEQDRIDEEETEDVNTSSGRSSTPKEETEKEITETNFKQHERKVERFLDKYSAILESKLNSEDSEKPTLIDLSMFLIIQEILLHLLSHKIKVKGIDKPQKLLSISFSEEIHSWSEYSLTSIGKFLLWITQKGGFKQIENAEYSHKLNRFKEMALKTNVAVLSLFKVVNSLYDIDKINLWQQLGLINSELNLFEGEINKIDIKDYLLFIPKAVIEEYGEAQILDTLECCINLITNPNYNSSYYKHPNDGIAYINKVIPNKSNSSLKFYKLIGLGYYWDEDLKDFWNGMVYSESESRWINAKK